MHANIRLGVKLGRLDVEVIVGPFINRTNYIMIYRIQIDACIKCDKNIFCLGLTYFFLLGFVIDVCLLWA